MDRYVRQLPVLGAAFQARLGAASVAVLGAGALGSAISLQLVRMGLGHVRLADFDRIELTNLHRQILFDEADVGRPKLAVAVEKLRRANPTVVVEPFAAKVVSGNLDAFLAEADLVLDATDSVAARYLLNDVCLARCLPLVLTAVAGVSGHVLPVLPGGPCLRCLYPDPPPPGEVANVMTRGLFPPVVLLAAALSVSMAVRILRGDAGLAGTFYRFDALAGTSRTVRLSRRQGCLCGSRRPES